MKTNKTPTQRRMALEYAAIVEERRRGRPALPADQAQTAMIRERVTEAQRAEYDARSGKAWLVRELGRKVRK